MCTWSSYCSTHVPTLVRGQGRGGSGHHGNSSQELLRVESAVLMTCMIAMRSGARKDTEPRRILPVVRVGDSSTHFHTQFAFARIPSVVFSALYYCLAVSVCMPWSLRVLLSI